MTLYWTTKEGKKINVDDMSDSHVRNAFKMMLRNIELQKQKARKDFKYLTGFTLNGDMAQQFNDAQEDYYLNDDSNPY